MEKLKGTYINLIYELLKITITTGPMVATHNQSSLPINKLGDNC